MKTANNESNWNNVKTCQRLVPHTQTHTQTHTHTHTHTQWNQAKAVLFSPQTQTRQRERERERESKRAIETDARTHKLCRFNTFSPAQTHACTQADARLPAHSATHAATRPELHGTHNSSTHSLTHSLSQSLTHSFTHSLTHPISPPPPLQHARPTFQIAVLAHRSAWCKQKKRSPSPNDWTLHHAQKNQGSVGQQATSVTSSVSPRVRVTDLESADGV